MSQPVPVISVGATDASGNEYLRDPIVFTITRSGSTTGSITINLGWSGTAILGTDYTVTATGGTLGGSGTTITLAAGVTSATITVTPTDDTTVESTETVTLTLNSRTGYALGTPTAANGSIIDNDGSATVSIAATDNAGAEQGSDPIVFTVTRGGNIWSNVVVNLGWTRTATFGTDYTATVTGGTLAANGLTLTLAPGADIGDGHVDPGRRCRRRGDRDADRDPAAGTGYTVGTPSARERVDRRQRHRRGRRPWQRPTRPAPSRAATRSSSRSRARRA